MTFQITRELAAPIDKVWQAWTDAKMIEQWYSPGPVNWSVDEFDVQPGGKFRMRMEMPQGEHVAEGTFSTVEAPTHLRQGPADGSMVIDTRLTASETGTTMVVSMEGLPDEQKEMMTGAWGGGFDKLERLLATS